ncbi:MAG: DJ-1/PfpI family protein [Candidatus Paceibacterota bacterium]
MKKIALIIASKDFRDEEFFNTKEALESGARVDVFSEKMGLALGRFGGEFKVKNNIKDLHANDYDAIVFIGGSGALERLDNETSYELVRSFLKGNKIIGAICISPIILAKAGALNKKNATVWSSSMDKTAIMILGENGAVYADLPVVIDGKVVTAKDFEASYEFGNAILFLLDNRSS